MRNNLQEYPNQDVLYDSITSEYISTAMSQLSAASTDYCHRQMATLGGRVCSIDSGFKNASRVRTAPAAGAAQVFTAVQTVLNDRKQVIGQWCGSNSSRELLPALMDLRRRFERLPPPKVSVSIVAFVRCLYDGCVA